MPRKGTKPRPNTKLVTFIGGPCNGQTGTYTQNAGHITLNLGRDTYIYDRTKPNPHNKTQEHQEYIHQPPTH